MDPMNADRVTIALLLMLCACGSDEGPSASPPLESEATAELVLGPGGTFGYGSSIQFTIRLTNPGHDTAWVNVAEDFGAVGATFYEDIARTVVALEFFNSKYYRSTYPAEDQPVPVREPIPPGEARSWTTTYPVNTVGAFLSTVRTNPEGTYGLELELVGDTIRVPVASFTFDAGLARLVNETELSLTGDGAAQFLSSTTRFRNGSAEPVAIFYGACVTTLRGYLTADRTGTPVWETGLDACGLAGYSDEIEPGATSDYWFPTRAGSVESLLGSAPRQRYYISMAITLNQVKIERPAGELDLTPP